MLLVAFSLPSPLLPPLRWPKGQSLVRPTCTLAHTIWFSWYHVSHLASSYLSSSSSSSWSSSSSSSSSSAAIASSSRAGDREANRKGVHHCRRLRSWTTRSARPRRWEKSRGRRRRKERTKREDQPEGAARDGTARCASHSEALFRPVFTEVNASARAHRRESNIAMRGPGKGR